MSRQLGQIACTTPMCSDGRAMVAQMWAVFNYLTANYQNFQPAQWQTQCQAIQASFDEVASFYDTWFPFNPVCCTELDIGHQAEALSRQMSSSVGLPDIPVPPPAAGTNWTTLLVVAGVITLAVVYSPQIKSAMAGK
jgi:hypothetical protein